MVTGPITADPVSCDEFGYGLGRPDGILVLRYRSVARLAFAENREDFLHQLYWSPDGLLSARHGRHTTFLGPDEVFWVHRGVTHEVHAADRQTVYRVCLREVPTALDGLRAGVAAIDAEAARLVLSLAAAGYDERDAPDARSRIMAGLAPRTDGGDDRQAAGTGVAVAVATALARDPGDSTGLAEWADRLHVSVKTLQRDFDREFGMSYSRWRTKLRLRASLALLETRPVGEVARRIGYASSSAFISAFAREYGYTPGHAATMRRAVDIPAPRAARTSRRPSVP
ncbi:MULTISPECIES: helix-turn-helix transcriptional regulator [unclassified Micromonospora]|uniref:helix-turn-helix transcriptional regulator n=1 Tax=unclassified Micromonospora TaxID=2617518 RepID=UPI001B36941E|nr:MULTISPECIES: helix-turn-helix transcriptional regulator [unclassified Micromonospora]MBQ1044367.1 helix-turn-helix transcriptional regulator [Micromonospora sp. C72]MBQ1056871.1 helix-turn-helix transcriptional regulator [Micromonospora sp. C32]